MKKERENNEHGNCNKGAGERKIKSQNKSSKQTRTFTTPPPVVDAVPTAPIVRTVELPLEKKSRDAVDAVMPPTCHDFPAALLYPAVKRFRKGIEDGRLSREEGTRKRAAKTLRPASATVDHDV